MTAFHARRGVRWLLPLLLWPLLLPPGVMPGSRAQGPALVLCDLHHGAMAPSTPAADHAGSTHHGKHAGTVCPFAAVGVTGPLPTAPIAAARHGDGACAVVLTSSQCVARVGPARMQLSRAPPALA